MPMPSRDTFNFEFEDISRKYESIRTRPETKSPSFGDFARAWDLERGLPGDNRADGDAWGVGGERLLARGLFILSTNLNGEFFRHTHRWSYILPVSALYLVVSCQDSDND